MNSFDFSRVVTTGAGGMVGAYVDFGIRPTHDELDILDEHAVMRFVMEKKPRAIIHLAGATDMTRCESESAYAYELNVRGTYNVARAAREVGAVMVYASTSRVFRGDKSTAYTEEDVPEPDTHYGRTKYFGEIIATALAPKCIIARTSWVFGGGPDRDDKFYGNVLKQLGEPEIVALHDVRGSPTFGKDYVATIKELLAKGESGTFHIANEGSATRYDIARKMAEELKPSVHVRAVDRSFFASGASLPENEAISSKRTTLRPWREALVEYLRDEWQPYLESAKIIP